ncbi:MAG: SRPBCC domain-containing protein [Archangium sp.]
MRPAAPFTVSFEVPRSPTEVFDAINDVRGWWTGAIEGRSQKPGDEFTYQYEDLHRSTQRVTELVPGQRVVWKVTDAQLKFPDPKEWTGTEIEFAISRSGEQTQVRFTHHGLLPSCQCYADCSGAWTELVTDNLKRRITTGRDAR